MQKSGIPYKITTGCRSFFLHVMPDLIRHLRSFERVRRARSRIKPLRDDGDGADAKNGSGESRVQTLSYLSVPIFASEEPVGSYFRCFRQFFSL